MIGEAVKSIFKRYTAKAADGSREASRLYRGTRLRTKLGIKDEEKKARAIDKKLSETSESYVKAKKHAKAAVESGYVQSVLRLAGKSTTREAAILKKQAAAIDKAIRKIQTAKRANLSDKVAAKLIKIEADKIKRANKIINEVKAGKYARKGIAGGAGIYAVSGDE